MNEGRTNVVIFRVDKWTGLCVYPGASKISFVPHFILLSLLSSLPFFVLCSHGFVLIFLHNFFFSFNSYPAPPISHPSLPLLSILLYHTSSFSSFPILLPALSQCSPFSLLSPLPFHSGHSWSPRTALPWVASTAFGSGAGMAAKGRCFIASWMCRQKSLTEMAVYTCHLGQKSDTRSLSLHLM